MNMYATIFSYGLFMFTVFVLGGFAAFKLKVFSKQEFKQFIKIKAITCGTAVIVAGFTHFVINLICN